ncbi:MAG: hypothetical protein JST91_07710 [Actinobacteria bacterium]|nr:hypothetical protein [Actinomycetota bacterium]
MGEVLRTLDADAAVDNMPFMPEMARFAGRRLQVSASAHKGCDTIETYRNRKIDRAVHLGVRCDGSAHGGCQASCLLYWKEDWLKPASGPAPRPVPPTQDDDMAVLDRATHGRESRTATGEVVYSCQATRFVEASSPMRRRHLRQYWIDVVSGNVSAWTFTRYMLLAIRNAAVRKVGRYDLMIPHGTIKGLATGKTPNDTLDLQVGDMVEVKTPAEIMTTLDSAGRNRGMAFDTEMLPFCGKRYRVKQRIERIINERTGVMMAMRTPAFVLEDVACMGNLHPERIFCPRRIYPFWREIWLKRVAHDRASHEPPSHAGAS